MDKNNLGKSEIICSLTHSRNMGTCTLSLQQKWMKWMFETRTKLRYSIRNCVNAHATGTFLKDNATLWAWMHSDVASLFSFLVVSFCTPTPKDDACRKNFKLLVTNMSGDGADTELHTVNNCYKYIKFVNLSVVNASDKNKMSISQFLFCILDPL